MREVEVRFLEINKEKLIKKLKDLGAVDHGEDFLEEIIFHDQGDTWKDHGLKLVRIRKTKDQVLMAYKDHTKHEDGGVTEIEFEVPDVEVAQSFLENVGLKAIRHQQKKRHTFKLKDFVFDIDEWPRVPTYLEIEGRDMKELQRIARELGLIWEKVIYEDAKSVIEKYYNIPVSKLKYFTFEKFE